MSPLYDYICNICGYEFETRQGINDSPMMRCPECDGKVRRVIGLVSLHFKGEKPSALKRMYKGRPIHQTEAGHWEQDGIV